MSESTKKNKESYDSILSEIFSKATKDVYGVCRGFYVGHKAFSRGFSRAVSIFHCIPSFINAPYSADDRRKYGFIDYNITDIVKLTGKLVGYGGQVIFYGLCLASSHPELVVMVPLATNSLSFGYEKYYKPIKNRMIKEHQDMVDKIKK